VSINRNALKKYAPKARQDFIAAVTARAAKFGITDGEPVPMQEQGEVVIISGEAFPKEIGAQRKALLGRIRQHGFGQIMEAVAYTWFNRFLAIRFMELHGYIDHGFRVLSHPDGGDLPEIIEHAEHLDLAELDKARVVELKLDGTKDAELYRLLLIAQCNALHDAMPFLFEKIDDETELLLPDNLLHSDSLIRELVNEIDEADWQEIEIIGWLYQFYISEKKDQVIGKVVKSEDIPAATQLFTPNWIVKYMVQNSLGHQWMATYPASSLKEGMEYYIKPAEQTPEVQAQLAEITPKELNPEELTLLDPAAGSGHILVEAYDLFKQIYLERGYRLKDIPRLILEKNLYGLDVDDRAAQMAGFALLMKARADDRRILSNPVHLNVMAIQSSEGLDGTDIAKHLLPSGRYEVVASDDLMPETLAEPTLAANATSEVKAGTIESLINLFEDAKTFGSLITVPENIRQALPALGQLLDQPSNGLPVERRIRENIVGELRPLLVQAGMLGRQYDCVVANPPYMGAQYLISSLKNLAKNKFKSAKSDLFAVFVDRSIDILKCGGSASFMTPFTWLFIASYEAFRRQKIDNLTFLSIVKPEYHSFFDSAYVPICAFSIKKQHLQNFKTTSFDFGDFYGAAEQPKKLRDGIQDRCLPFVYDRIFESFKAIPSCPLAFSLNANLLTAFKDRECIGSDAKKGTTTGDNDHFVRLWHEVGYTKFSLGGGEKWFPMTKGGSYRKWYGNFDFVINWENDGEEVRNFKDENGKLRSAPRNLNFNFTEGITWNDVTVSDLTARYVPDFFVFNAVGPMVFGGDIHYRIGMLNSKVNTQILRVLCPTMKYEVGAISQVPIGAPYVGFPNDISASCIKIAKSDWNSFETSWDFESTPMLSDDLKRSTTKVSFSAWQSLCNSNIQTMKDFEEENNRLFIEAYGLQDELTPDVSEDQITLAHADREQDTKRLISYAIGCMMGRYSLVEEGLIYANSGNEGFDPTRYGDFPADDDGIIPITDTEWFDDDATVRFEKFLKVAWSSETLKENLKFIGDSLANNGGNDPLKTIRNYFSKGFYKDHLKTYKKRPIYWLFSSGKQRAFECLVYLHRYNEGTLARMRMEYVTPLHSRMSARIDQLRGDVESASSSVERTKKQKEQDKLVKQLEELRAFDEELRHYADQRITLDLDDGVKVNYGKFGNLLADVKAITGKK
jgi:hypothetical protein